MFTKKPKVISGFVYIASDIARYLANSVISPDIIPIINAEFVNGMHRLYSDIAGFKKDHGALKLRGVGAPDIYLCFAVFPDDAVMTNPPKATDKHPGHRFLKKDINIQPFQILFVLRAKSFNNFEKECEFIANAMYLALFVAILEKKREAKKIAQAIAALFEIPKTPKEHLNFSAARKKLIADFKKGDEGIDFNQILSKLQAAKFNSIENLMFANLIFTSLTLSPLTFDEYRNSLVRIFVPEQTVLIPKELVELIAEYAHEPLVPAQALKKFQEKVSATKPQKIEPTAAPKASPQSNI